MDILKQTKQQLQEESLIDIAYALLNDRTSSMTVPDLFEEMRTLTGFTKKEMMDKLPQFYTDMNVDGRFLALDEGQWGLREWYPLEQIAEETAPVVKTHEDEEDEEVFEEDEDLLLEDEDEEEILIEEEDEDEEDLDIDYDAEEYEEEEFEIPEEDLDDEE